MRVIKRMKLIPTTCSPRCDVQANVCRSLLAVLAPLICLFQLLSINTVAIGQERRSDKLDLLTVAESSGFEATATYDQVMEFCNALSSNSNRIHLTDFGSSFEGRELPLLVVADPPIESPEELAKSQKLPVFVMANIHAGEVCGKEATLMLAREMAGEAGDELLKHITLLIAPIYNADGNERFSKDNRPGQLGPERGMGQRQNMQGLDLNRDHIKLESPEAQALARLITEWDPVILIDTHTTNGSYHRYALTYDGPRNPATPGDITSYVRDQFLPSAGEHVAEQSGYKTFYYGNFDEAHQQWETYPDLPRYSTHYFGIRGRIGILSEAYSYATYRDRVLATKQFVESCCHVAAEDVNAIRNVISMADKKPEQVAIRSEPVALERPFDVLGYVETTNEDGKRVATDQPIDYAGVRYLGRSQPTLSVETPDAYVVPAKYENVIQNLQRHGISIERISSDRDAEVERYVINRIQRADREFQGHRNLQLDVEKKSMPLHLDKGDALVKVSARFGPLIVSLLEPESADGLAAWNFFDDDLKEGGYFPVVRLRRAVD